MQVAKTNRIASVAQVGCVAAEVLPPSPTIAYKTHYDRPPIPTSSALASAASPLSPSVFRYRPDRNTPAAHSHTVAIPSKPQIAKKGFGDHLCNMLHMPAERAPVATMEPHGPLRLPSLRAGLALSAGLGAAAVGGYTKPELAAVPPPPLAQAACPVDGVRRFLSAEAEAEAVAVLREQLARGQRVTSDDVRYVVRVLAGRADERLSSHALPADFPPTRWILDLKRRHGFSAQATAAGMAADEASALAAATAAGSTSGTAASASGTSRSSSSEGEDAPDRDMLRQFGADAALSRRRRRYGYGYGYEFDNPRLTKQRYVVPAAPFYDDSPTSTSEPMEPAATSLAAIRLPWPTPSRDMDENASATDATSVSRSSSSSSSNGAKPASFGPLWGTKSFRGRQVTPPGSRSGSSACREGEDRRSAASSGGEKRKYKLSHTVAPDVWEKAIAAVEQQGMSLRAAAKIYGVHFAALHRRVKKRAASGAAAKGTHGYFHPSDEAGIMRVVVARAELGVLMTFDELMELVETAALRKLPDISVDAARALMTRFQTRNEQSIRHIVVDWPPPRGACEPTAPL